VVWDSWGSLLKVTGNVISHRFCPTIRRRLLGSFPGSPVNFLNGIHSSLGPFGLEAAMNCIFSPWGIRLWSLLYHHGCFDRGRPGYHCRIVCSPRSRVRGPVERQSRDMRRMVSLSRVLFAGIQMGLSPSVLSMSASGLRLTPNYWGLRSILSTVI